MLSYLFLAVLPSAWLVAAINDLMEMKIPNWISLALVGVFPVAAFYFGMPVNAFLSCVILSVGVLVAGFALFAINKLGGGDVKLLAASALWIGPMAFPSFFIKMILMGGLFAFTILMFRRTPLLPVYAHSPWIMRLHQSSKQMPYGVAIAAGGLWALPETYLLTLVFG